MQLTKQIQQPIVVFNVGWMKHYQGFDKEHDVITGKAKFIAEKKWGYEIYNFLPFEGKVYGFVQPSGHGKDYLERQIRIENIDSKVQATSEYIDDVLVVWVAPYVQGGTYLVGWYEHARIYRHYQEKSTIKNRNHENQTLGYFATANERDAVCLHETDRIIDELKLQRASSAKKDNKGGLGHSCVWFARIDESRPYNLKFREKILDFISEYKQKNQHYIEKQFLHEINQSSPNEREKRLKKASKQAKRIQIVTTQFQRNPDVVAEVLMRAKGYCELCKKVAPFMRASNGEPYLEVHHKIPLADGGDDSVENAIALCPNCHRYSHYGL